MAKVPAVCQGVQGSLITRKIEEPQHIHTVYVPRILGCLALQIVEACWYGHNCIVHLHVHMCVRSLNGPPVQASILIVVSSRPHHLPESLFVIYACFLGDITNGHGIGRVLVMLVRQQRRDKGSARGILRLRYIAHAVAKPKTKSCKHADQALKRSLKNCCTSLIGEVHCSGCSRRFVRATRNVP